MTVIIAILVGASVLGLYFAIVRLTSKQRQSSEMTQRLHSADELFASGSYNDEGTQDQPAHELSARAQTMDKMVAAIMAPFGKNAQTEYLRIRKQLLYAGIRSVDAPVYYFFYHYIASPILVLIAASYLWGLPSSPRQEEDGIIGLILLIIGAFGHRLYLKNKIEKRQKDLTRSFPDMLDLLLICVESGLALDAALARVCKELGAAHPLLTEEVNRTRMELSVFSDRSKALYGLGERTNVTALKSLSASLVQSEKFGTSLGDTLRVMSDDYRMTRLLMAEAKAAKLPALMTIPLITMLLPAMFIIILAPAILGVMAQGGIFGGG